VWLPNQVFVKKLDANHLEVGNAVGFLHQFEIIAGVEELLIYIVRSYEIENRRLVKVALFHVSE